MRISPTAILLLVVFATLLFGAKRLPDAARALGRSLRVMKSEVKALKTETSEAYRSDGDAAPEPERVVKSAPGAARGDRAA